MHTSSIKKRTALRQHPRCALAVLSSRARRCGGVSVCFHARGLFLFLQACRAQHTCPDTPFQGRQPHLCPHARPLSCMTFFMVLPSCAGDLLIVTPAASSAAILSVALPFPPLMMAPAWPMRRPGGAVRPAGMQPGRGHRRQGERAGVGFGGKSPPTYTSVRLRRLCHARTTLDWRTWRGGEGRCVGLHDMSWQPA